MPVVQKIFCLDVNPEKFLSACSPDELIEVELLLGSPRYQNVIRNHLKKHGNESDNIQTEQLEGPGSVSPGICQE